MYLLPLTTIDKLDKTRKKFFWQGDGMRRKYHLVKWEIITKPKDKGGLGIKDSRKMNISLLCICWWKLENEDGLWQEIARKKYLKHKCLQQVAYKANNSPMWNDMIEVKHIYLMGRSMKVGNDHMIDFWRDILCANVSLKDKFAGLYDICTTQNCPVNELCCKNWWLDFQRWLDEGLQDQLRRLRDIIFRYKVNEAKDVASWDWEKTGNFSVKSMSKNLCCNSYGPNNKQIWNAKLPLKIKIFIRLPLQNTILTKDNLIK